MAAVCPTLAHLPEHRDEVALLGQQGQGIARCPRCQIAPYEFTVLGVKIDFCTRCAGVWLDGDEYAEAMLEGAEPAGGEGGGGPYRRAASQIRSGAVKCVYCDAEIAVDKAYMRELGLACRACHFAREQRATDQRVRAAEARGGPILKGIVAILDALVEPPRR